MRGSFTMNKRWGHITECHLFLPISVYLLSAIWKMLSTSFVKTEEIILLSLNLSEKNFDENFFFLNLWVFLIKFLNFV